MLCIARRALILADNACYIMKILVLWVVLAGLFKIINDSRVTANPRMSDHHITFEIPWPACREEGRRCLCNPAGLRRSFLSRLVLP
jgi:hypothetical protein